MAEILLTLSAVFVVLGIGAYIDHRRRPETIADGYSPSEKGLHGR